MIKRLLDLLIAATALILTGPLLAVAALAIVVESGWPVIYRHTRVGRDGRSFDLLKLRTMVRGAESIGSGLVVERDDPRITRVGRLLRRTSIDELPNLVNVLRGEMSIVGPRPTVLSQVKQYDDRQLRRLEVRPGLTGWAQVNGRSALPWSERIELDLWYVDHRGTALDLRIIARTAWLLVTGAGLYRGERGGWR